MAGKSTMPPFTSARYRSMYELDTKQKGIFPYDVPYFSKKTVSQLMDLSKQFYYTDMVHLRLSRYPDFPENLLLQLEKLKRIRFFKDELLFELKNRLNPVEFVKYSDIILGYCSDFSKLKTALWNKERAKAHIQTTDVLLRRVSATDSLWILWCKYEKEGKRMDENQIRRQIECLSLGINLTPPMWLQHVSRVIGKSTESLWREEIEKKGFNIQQLRQQHFKMVRENNLKNQKILATNDSPLIK